MLIVCPSCATSYDVDLASLGPSGRSVRCLRCRTVWNAAPSRADQLLAAASAIAPDDDMAPGQYEAHEAPSVALQPDDDAFATPLGRATSREADAHEDTGQDDADAAASYSRQDDPALANDEVAYSDEHRETAQVEAPPIAPADLDEEDPPPAVDRDHAAPVRRSSRSNGRAEAARRTKRAPRGAGLRWPLGGLQTVILALLIVDAVLLGWRGDVVRFLPQTASFYAALGMPVNIRGLGFTDVATTTEQHEGVPILMVAGEVVNNARKPIDVPRLKFIVRNAVHQEIYSWTAVPSRTPLPPGETTAFSARLASPPPDGHDVLVRFVNRRDIIGAGR